MKHIVGKDYEITVPSAEPHFDFVCSAAKNAVLHKVGCDDNGYLHNVVANNRSTDSVQITFISCSMGIGMGGHTHDYTFKYKIIRCED